MAFPWSLVLFQALVCGLMQATPPKLSEAFVNRTSDETEIPSDDDTVTSVTSVPLYSSIQDDQKGDIRKSLKFIEAALLAANNSLPIEIQQHDSLTVTIHTIRLTLTNRIPLTFYDIKQIFVALNKSSHRIFDYTSGRDDRAQELDFAAIAMKDILKVLCDIAVKLNTRGLLLKSYFEFYLGEKAELKTIDSEFFDRIKKVVDAAKFC